MNIIYFEELDSTNTFAKKNIEKYDDGTIIAANKQTNGHGRFNRSWIDFGNKNIFMTFILKPSNRIEKNYANLTQYLSVCVCEVFENFGLKPQIKWPNDILVNGKKISGILAEAVINKNILKGIALGIGINVNAKKTDVDKINIPVTALNLEGVSTEKEILIEKISERFFKNYNLFLHTGFREIKDYYTNHAYLPEKCKIAIFDKTITGEFRGFDDDGQLMIFYNDNLTSINMGEFTE